MPAFMSPSIRYAKPLWQAYADGLRGSVEVSGSTFAEARFAAAKKLGVTVRSVRVHRVYDTALFRFGARA